MSPEFSGLTSICKRVENKKRNCLSLGVGFPGGSDGKESACNEGHLGSIPGLGRSPGGEHGNPLQYSYLENPRGQKSLAGYSPWGRRVGHDGVSNTSLGVLLGSFPAKCPANFLLVSLANITTCTLFSDQPVPCTS